MQLRSKIAIVVVLLAATGTAYFVLSQKTETKTSVATPTEQVPPAEVPPAPTRASSSSSSTSQPAGMTAPQLDDDPIGTLRLEGQVIDEEGRPVGGAIVRLSSAPPQDATSEEDGSFSFEKLVGRSYALHARSSDRVGGPVLVDLSASSDPVVIRVHAGGGVDVEVVDSDNAPIVGATVVLGDDFASAQTDASGVAKLRNIPSGPNLAHASADGFAQATSLVNIPKDVAVVATQRIVLSRGVSVSGIVVDHKGKPVADAKVIAQSVGMLLQTQNPRKDGVSSDAKGRFTLPAVAVGHVQLLAWHEEHAPSSTERMQVGDSPITDVTIVMKQGASLAGVVLTGDGDAVPWATVRVVGARDGWASGVHRQVVAEEDGTFRLAGLPRASMMAHASSDEASSEGLAVDLKSNPKTTGVELVLTQTGTIAGVVVDEKGEPIAEAQVTATPDFWEGADMDQLRVRGASFATTGGDGAFTIRGLPKSKYKVSASLSVGSTMANFGQGVAASTGDDNVRIVLATPGSIVGTLRTKDGKTPEFGSVSVGWGASVPAVNGAFRLRDVRPGTYELTARGPSFSDTFVPGVVVVSGETLDLGDITVVDGRSVTGRVVDGAGRGVDGADVALAKQLISEGKNLSPTGLGKMMDEQMGVRRTQSDDQGNFRLGGIGEAEMTLVADHAEIGRSAAMIIAKGSDDVVMDLRLAGVGSIKGTVTLNGTPKAGAQLLTTPTSGATHIAVASSDDKGEFYLERLAAGEYKVSAMVGGMGNAAMAATTVQVVAGQETTAKLDIEEGSLSFTVTVTGKDNAMIDSAQVFLFDGVVAITSGAELNKQFLSASGNAKMEFAKSDGVVTFKKVIPSSYSVCVIPITGDMNDPTFAQKLQRNVDTLAVYCKPVEIAAAPEKQSFSMAVPPMTPLPE